MTVVDMIGQWTMVTGKTRDQSEEDAVRFFPFPFSLFLLPYPFCLIPYLCSSVQSVQSVFYVLKPEVATVARENLFQSITALFGVVAIGAKKDPATFGAAAEEIAAVVREANAVTRSGQTRRENAAAAEQAEQAAASGQGSAGAGGGSQHATLPPQGSPATSLTPETNPVGPPTGKGAATA
jgi:hypothetical protein